MNSDKPIFSKAAQTRPRREKKLGNNENNRGKAPSASENIILKHLNIGVDWFDGNHNPEPWVWASAVTLHLFLIAIFISIPPMEFKERQVFGVDIINQTEPQKPEPEPIETPKPKEAPQPIVENKTAEPIPNKTIEKPIEPVIEEIPPTTAPMKIQMPPPEEVQKLEPVKPKQLKAETEIAKKIAPIPKILPIEEIKTPQIEENNEPIEEIKTPERLSLEPVQRPILKNTIKIETKNNNSAAPINLGARALSKSKNSNLPTLNPNLNINSEELQRQAEEREAQQLARELAAKTQAAQAQAARESAAREQAAKLSQSKAINNANTAPIAKNGELASPSSSGITAIAAGGVNGASSGANSSAPNGPQSGGSPAQNANNGNNGNGGPGGPLPRGPRIVGNGRNVFESNQNNSLLARMSRTADCSTIGRERDEKCPNWAPMEKAAKQIPAPIPKDTKRPPTGIDPLPACPLGAPQSNMGITCLPSKSAPNGRTQ